MERFTRIPKLRWLIAGLLLAVTLLNYADRMTLSVLVNEVRQSLQLSETDYSHIVGLFFAAYAIMYAGSGYIVDRLGTRLGMAVFVCAWSVCQMLHGLATGGWSFAACRFGLGLAEPGSFPAATKAIGEWFPAQQRAVGVGVFNTGSILGAAVAAPLAAFLALKYGWRGAFIFTGALGFLWVAAWLLVYQPPRRSRWLSNQEVGELQAGESGADRHAAQIKYNWLAILGSRPGRMLILARFLTDPVIYFVMFWLPAYLEKERGFDLQMVGKYAWIPWAIGGPGYVLGGWLSGRMMRAGRSAVSSRKVAMLGGAALLPVAIAAPLAPSYGMALGAMCVVVLGHAIWITNLMTLPADLFPAGAVGTAAGFAGMGGAAAGALANWFTGSLVSHFSYLPIFISAGVLHPVAAVLIWRLLPDELWDKPAVRPMPFEEFVAKRD